jgi:hypothetical protein
MCLARRAQRQERVHAVGRRRRETRDKRQETREQETGDKRQESKRAREREERACGGVVVRTSQNHLRMSTKLIFSGSYTTLTPSVWPVRPEQASSYVGLGVKPAQ